jgi:hypothetical protein
VMTALTQTRAINFGSDYTINPGRQAGGLAD